MRSWQSCARKMENFRNFCWQIFCLGSMFVKDVFRFWELWLHSRRYLCWDFAFYHGAGRKLIEYLVLNVSMPNWNSLISELCIKLCWECFLGIFAKGISAELVVKEIVLQNMLTFALMLLTRAKLQINDVLSPHPWVLPSAVVHWLDSCLSVPINLCDEIWPKLAKVAYLYGNSLSIHLAAPEYHQAVQIKMSWNNVTAG